MGEAHSRSEGEKNLLLALNGLLAKFGLWQARRHGTAQRLERLATEQAGGLARRPNRA